jgi:hypothetical protein
MSVDDRDSDAPQLLTYWEMAVRALAKEVPVGAGPPGGDGGGDGGCRRGGGYPLPPGPAPRAGPRDPCTTQRQSTLDCRYLSLLCDNLKN